MKIKVRELNEEVHRIRTGGDVHVKYKILSVEGIDLQVEWKVTDISNDLDSGNQLGGTFYLTESEFGKIVAQGAEVKIIPVDQSIKMLNIPIPKPGEEGA